MKTRENRDFPWLCYFTEVAAPSSFPINLSWWWSFRIDAWLQSRPSKTTANWLPWRKTNRKYLNWDSLLPQDEHTPQKPPSLGFLIHFKPSERGSQTPASQVRNLQNLHSIDLLIVAWGKPDSGLSYSLHWVVFDGFDLTCWVHCWEKMSKLVVPVHI